MGCLKLTYRSNLPQLKVVQGFSFSSEESCAGLYRYGFNGMEMDNEVSGNGNSYTTEFRQYDPRLGRWKSLDPLKGHFPWTSPYVAFENNPIYFTDPYGLASDGPNDGGPEKKGETYTDDKGIERTITHGGVTAGAPKKEIPSSIDNKNKGYIRQYSELSNEEKNLIHIGASKATVRPFNSGKARVRTDDTPLFTLGGTGYGNRGIYDEYKNGYGPEESIFFIGHKATQDLKNLNNEISRLRTEIYKKFNGDIDALIEYANENSRQVYTDFRSHHGTFLPSDEGFNSAQFIGTFSADVFYDKNAGNLVFVVSDSKSLKSETYRLMGNIERKKNTRTPNGNTYQKYIWTEKVK